MTRAALLAGAAALLFCACGGDPFAFVPLGQVDAGDVLEDDARAPLVDASPELDADGARATLDAAGDAAERDSRAATDGTADAAGDVLEADAGAEASPADSGPPPAVCCRGQAVTTCAMGAGFVCYPAGSRCSADCQALPDGGTFCTASCTGSPSACSPSSCALGAGCVYQASGQSWPGTVGPCD